MLHERHLAPYLAMATKRHARAGVPDDADLGETAGGER